ncbi:hypothetical protein BM477_05735 [Boudabousia marimammalium]|uniref:Bifunctional folate synthesis protein n=1 Tax=Boudabousia marimammalium TaxID=156892 RepID=A0A1Q5PMI8_9ACTO|nr:hypothetical protein BM477_05735 [Boudabousia marimammalium]
MHEWERVQGQQFIADIELSVDTEVAAHSDELDDTVNYSDLAKKVHSIIAGNTFNLLESVAQRVAVGVLDDERILAVKITLHKPAADCGVGASDVSVAIERDRSWYADYVNVLGSESAEPSSPEDEAEGNEAGEEPDSAMPVVVSAPNPSFASFAELLKGDTETDHAQTDDETVVGEAEAEQPHHIFTDKYVLALGANIGATQHNLRWAVGQLESHPLIELLEVSPLVKTPAALAPGQAPQPDYSNAIVILTTELSVEALFEFTQNLEVKAGRRLGEHWQPRPLDIDIIAIGNQRWQNDRLTIPHPRAHERIFVLGPWAMTDQEASFPDGQLVADMADALPTRDDIVSFDTDWLAEGFPAAPLVVAEEDPVPTFTQAADVVTETVKSVPRRRSIRERLQEKDPVVAQMERELKDGNEDAKSVLNTADLPAQSPAVRTSTSMRRVVVRPTTTGTIPILPPEDFDSIISDEAEKGK